MSVTKNFMSSSKSTPYRICQRCIMDTTDPIITFDERGFCNHCAQVNKTIQSGLWSPTGDEKKLSRILEKIKKYGREKPYDCIIGLSGGVDSSYLAYLVVRKFGLRPLAIHVDAGWNSEQAVHNIENLVRNLSIDLYTEVVEWDEIKSLQRSYIKAGVANQDVPQDHAFFTLLYRKAKEFNIHYFLSGGNYATESILPRAWGYDAMDAWNLKDIHAKHENTPLNEYKTISFFDRSIYYNYIYKLNLIRPLNYINYNRDTAIRILETEMKWKNYGRKHGESVWTKWFQNYYLPEKFNFDKRKCHLSSMIMSGQIDRNTALAHINDDLYDSTELRRDTNFIIKKLGFTKEEFFGYFKKEISHYSDYKNQAHFLRIVLKIRKMCAQSIEQFWGVLRNMSVLIKV